MGREGRKERGTEEGWECSREKGYQSKKSFTNTRKSSPSTNRISQNECKVGSMSDNQLMQSITQTKQNVLILIGAEATWSKIHTHS